VGIDVGESAVIQYGLGTNDYAKTEKKDAKEKHHNQQDADKHDNINAKREPYMDIMGYTINTASKMTWFARPNQFVIGDAVSKRLDDGTTQNFG
jgi:hypothetical protein